MILEGLLPFSKVSATGENVLIQNITMDIIILVSLFTEKN